MSHSPTRPITAADLAAIEAAAQRFCARHGIPREKNESWLRSVTSAVDLEAAHHTPNWRRVGPLWHACFCRALKMPVRASTTLGWGYVGRAHRVD